MVAMGKTQESQDKDFGYPGDRIVNHFLVLNSQTHSGMIKKQTKTDATTLPGGGLDLMPYHKT